MGNQQQLHNRFTRQLWCRGTAGLLKLLYLPQRLPEPPYLRFGLLRPHLCLSQFSSQLVFHYFPIAAPPETVEGLVMLSGYGPRP